MYKDKCYTNYWLTIKHQLQFISGPHTSGNILIPKGRCREHLLLVIYFNFKWTAERVMEDDSTVTYMGNI